MDFYLYILYSPKFDKFYIGYSADLWIRLDQHNSGTFHKFTSSYRPWGLSAVFKIGRDRSLAMKMEKFIKKQKSRSLLEKLIDVNFVPEGFLAQLVRVPHVRD
ncbi:GIY-YIG nuclease family protein [Belliella kenyensis]|uniref:GIY-YIG nuclease family protein n=1 Tax=Belliella kenyensis TaxID=1472724 RepID=A0ABV8EIX9_9BACT|nr:GIY-YIG nuclease family protein [Belliella kenyensis]MCH7401148.1 GIY-YIG nuclease family protein [Belliella kenyensis]MDN3604145.1 GIY-YIG nuclease family protein [Belliella kenyensis]